MLLEARGITKAFGSFKAVDDASVTLERAPTDDRLPVLDGIRGLAIFMIMQYHFWGLGFGFVGVEPRRRIDRLAFGAKTGDA